MTYCKLWFCWSKIGIIYFESLVGKSKPPSLWVGPAQHPLLMWCCCSSVLCSNYPEELPEGTSIVVFIGPSTQALCAPQELWAVFFPLTQCYPCFHNKHSNKMLSCGSKGWNSWKMNFWKQLWIISMRRKRGISLGTKVAAQGAPASSAFQMGPHQDGQKSIKQWIQKKSVKGLEKIAEESKNSVGTDFWKHTQN